jgi:hypothetical protein
MKERFVWLASRKFPGRGYTYKTEEGAEPERYVEIDGPEVRGKRGWPPADDLGPHEVVRIAEWDPAEGEESYQVTWQVGWGSCD